MTTTVLHNAVTATTTGRATSFDDASMCAFQAWGTTSSGSGAATVLIEVSNDSTHFMTVGTISLTLGTSATQDGFVMEGSWAFVRASVTAISGTGAAVTVTMGV